MSEFISAKDALQRLFEGNQRFISGVRSIDSIASIKNLADLAKNGQRPFGAVLACADSRVPVETVFDCGLGSLFVNRLAGNLVTPHIIASLEFAVLELGVRLILIMGHTGCGATKAALAASSSGKELSRSLKVLVDDLKPAVETARLAGAHGEALTHAVERENVRLGCAALLAKSPELARLAAEDGLDIRGALFDMDTGRVEIGLEQANAAILEN